MLKELFFPLVNRFTFFNIFQYITFRSAYAAITALAISFLFGPKVIELLRKLNARQSIRHDGPKSHQAKTGTPTMGGVLIIVSVLVSVLLWQDLRNVQTWVGLFALIGFGIIGFVDDALKIFRRDSVGLRAGVKFSGQVAVSLVVILFLYTWGEEDASMLYLPFFKFPVVDLSVLFLPFAVVLIVGFSNAVNLADGLDGLSTGLVILVGITFALLAYITGRVDYSAYLQIPYLGGSGELTVLCLSIVGASVGFLWYNSHPAEVFMGDTGSLSLGGVIAVIAIMIKKEILLLVVGGVFVIEAVSVILQVVSFKLTGKRIFKMAPLHHHFEMMGWAESKIVIRFWILGGLFSILSLSTLKLQ